MKTKSHLGPLSVFSLLLLLVSFIAYVPAWGESYVASVDGGNLLKVARISDIGGSPSAEQISIDIRADFPAQVFSDGDESCPVPTIRDVTFLDPGGCCNRVRIAVLGMCNIHVPLQTPPWWGRLHMLLGRVVFYDITSDGPLAAVNAGTTVIEENFSTSWDTIIVPWGYTPGESYRIAGLSSGGFLVETGGAGMYCGTWGCAEDNFSSYRYRVFFNDKYNRGFANYEATGYLTERDIAGFAGAEDKFASVSRGSAGGMFYNLYRYGIDWTSSQIIEEGAQSNYDGAYYKNQAAPLADVADHIVGGGIVVNNDHAAAFNYRPDFAYPDIVWQPEWGGIWLSNIDEVLGISSNDANLYAVLRRNGANYELYKINSADGVYENTGFSFSWEGAYRSDGDAIIKKFEIGLASPNKGGDTGMVSPFIYGTGLASGASVKLARAGEPDITPQQVVFKNRNTLIPTFDLRGKARGSWDIVVTNPDTTTTSLADGFTIEEGRVAAPWVSIVGSNAFRSGFPYTFKVVYGNNGNIDAHGVPLFISGIPNYVNVQLDFELTPPPQLNDPPIDFSQWSTVITSADGTHKIIPLLIGNIPPGNSRSLSITLTQTGNQPFTLKAMIAKPWFGSGISYEALQCFMGALQLACTSVPVLDCITAALSFGFDLGDLVLGAPAGWDDVGSLTWGAINLGMQCADEAGFVGSEIAFDPWSIVASGTFSTVDCGTDALGIEMPLIPFSSGDPNAKYGLQGVGSARNISGEDPVPYSVFFENVETATAPAREIVITDQLDTSTLDLSTFSLGPISFGSSEVVPPQGLSDYTTVVDLRPGNDLLVGINARLNSETGLLTFRFTSIDPNTGGDPGDPLAGFLPPNVSPPEGEGSVIFTVKPKPALGPGTEIKNKATIVFDMNEPVETNEWLNTIDIDSDGDGYISAADCDDTNSSVKPGASEVCDAVDNNCDGMVDEGFAAPLISDMSVEGCLSELCKSDLNASATDSCGGNLTYAWTPLNGGAISGSGASVRFDPPDNGPHPCPYQAQLTVTSDVSGLSSTQVVDIYIKTAGDVNGDGVVNLMDKLLVRQHFGQSEGDPDWDPRADATCDGVVNLMDKLKVRQQFGRTGGCGCQ
ncbi:MAG: hypothetical protein HZA16_04875 [Nitrospirae bacterium]|nr:hypothetical protein [Nitrospirota bacterium]